MIQYLLEDAVLWLGVYIYICPGMFCSIWLLSYQIWYTVSDNVISQMLQEKGTNKYLKPVNCVVLEKWLVALYHQAVKLEFWNLLS